MAHPRGVPDYMWQRLDRKLLLHLMLGLVGVLTILYSTRWGSGLSPDSLGYISGAENLLRGQGYSHVTGMGQVEPTIQWPPLFSLALTPFGFVGISIFEGARWLNALLFGINILLVGYIVYRNTSFWPSIFASLMILTSVDLIQLHAMAYSEPLYFFLGLSGLYSLARYVNNSKTYPLIISALFVSAATLTRYIGVTLIATLCVGILILGKRGLRQRLVDCFIAGFISSLPLLLFLIRNVLVSGRISYVGTYQTHLLITARHIKGGLDTISLWLLPESISFGLRALTLVAVVLVMLLMMARLRNRGTSSFLYLNVIYVFVYCLGLTLCITFVDPNLLYDLKYLSPVFVSVVLILTLSMYRISLRASRQVGIGMSAFCVLFSVFCVERAVFVVNNIRQNGLGYESPVWQQSKIISSLKKLPGDVRIYTSFPPPIRFLSQREIRGLPYKLHPMTGNPSPDYLPKLQEIGATSQSQRTVIICVSLPPYFPSEDDLKQVLSLKEIIKAPEGSVYEVLH